MENTKQNNTTEPSAEVNKIISSALFERELEKQIRKSSKIETQLSEHLLNTYTSVRYGLFDRAEKILKSLGINNFTIQDVNIESDYVTISFEDIISSINDSIDIPIEVFNSEESIEDYKNEIGTDTLINSHNAKINEIKNQIKSISERKSSIDLQILILEQQLFLLLQKKYTSINGIIYPTQMCDFI